MHYITVKEAARQWGLSDRAFRISAEGVGFPGPQGFPWVTVASQPTPHPSSNNAHNRSLLESTFPSRGRLGLGDT